ESLFPLYDSVWRHRIYAHGVRAQHHCARLTEMKYRSLPVALFLLVLVVPFVLRWTAGSLSPRPAEAEQRVIVISPHAETIRTEFAAAFSAWYQQRYGTPVFV